MAAGPGPWPPALGTVDSEKDISIFIQKISCTTEIVVYIRENAGAQTPCDFTEVHQISADCLRILVKIQGL